jgi:hypothetical protein
MCLNVRQEMSFELLVRAIWCPKHDLITENFASKSFIVGALLGLYGFFIRWDLNSEDGALLGDDFDSPLFCDDFKNKLAITDNHALNANSTRTVASDNLDRSAVKLSACKLHRCAGSSRVNVVSK